MDAKTIKQDCVIFQRYFPTVLPLMGWHFSSEHPADTVTFPSDKWTCMFQYINKIAEGFSICFSAENHGCAGAACYLGFKQPEKNAGTLLATKEKFKKTPEFGNDFYSGIAGEESTKDYLIVNSINEVEDSSVIEVINCWVTPQSLAGLVTLANFDSSVNDNVLIPFASGCQSMWTLPYAQKKLKNQKSIIGSMDPAMRRYLKHDTVLFSVPANRFHEMVQNIPESFAVTDSWLNLIQSI